MATETLTIARIGQEKVIEYTNKKTGKPDSFKKVGVLTNEHGEKWFDLTFRGEVPVQVGKQYDFEVSEREYVNKAGETKTSYDLKLPREEKKGGGMADAQYVSIMRKLDTIITELQMARGVEKGIDPAKTYQPAITPPGGYPEGPKGTVDFEPPVDVYDDPENPANIPF